MHLLSLLVLPFILGAPNAAFAVCLLTDYSVQGEYDRSTAVIIGQVVAERTVPETRNYYDGTIYTVKIEEHFRGSLREEVDLFSENSSGRFSLQPGSRYLLFVYGASGMFMVDNCGNSGLLSEKEAVLQAVKRLVSGKSPLQKPNHALESGHSASAGQRGR